MSHNKKRNFAPIITILIIALGIIAAAGFLLHSLFFGNGNGEADLHVPNMDEVNFFDYHRHLDARHIHVVINGEIMTLPDAPLFIDGQLHLPAGFLREYVDRHIFWEKTSSRLTITNADEVMRFRPNEDEYTVNWEVHPLAHPIRQIAGMAYMSAEMIMEKYPVDIIFQAEYNFVILQSHRYRRMIYEVMMDEEEYEFIPKRFGSNDQYPIMARLYPGDRVTFFGDYYGGFYRVQTENGLSGYVLAENLRLINMIPAIPEIEQRRPVTRAANEPVNLVWHLRNVGNPETWYVPHGVTVLSPVWLTFNEDLSGDIISRANHAYVNWAHSHGMEVWPMIQDADRDGAFCSGISRAVLTDAYVRDHVIAQLMGFVEYFNLDGIQINYEVVQPDFAEEWIQFLRELAVPMRRAGAVMSVTVKPPFPHNMFWNRTEIGLTSDYAIIMAYDEHWSTKDTAGPVASFNFVANAVRNTLNEIPVDQVVLALPTYVRIWREEFVDGEWRLVDNNRLGVAQRSVGMSYARNFIESRGGEFLWDYVIRQYYAEVEFEQNGTEMRYRVWLEDLRSIDEKLWLVGRYDLVGAAFWQKGLELPAMWELVYGHLN